MSIIARIEMDVKDGIEKLRADRLTNERRFSTNGRCPWDCLNGWRELYPHEVGGKQPTDIRWNGGWWTPCECNPKAILPVECTCEGCHEVIFREGLCFQCYVAEKTADWDTYAEERDYAHAVSVGVG